MKRIILALAVLLSVQVAADAQKSIPDAKKAVEAALEATNNPKKAIKVATWLKLADAYMTAHDVPAGAGWVGAGPQELQLILGNEKPLSSEPVVLQGENYTKSVFKTRNYYYNAGGVLAIIEVTEYAYEDALEKAMEAYKQAYSIDEKKSKEKDIKAGMLKIASKYLDEGMTCYQLGDIKGASRKFAAAAKASATEPASALDTSALYNAGLTAWMAGDNEFAKERLEECLINNYYEGGEVYAKLADINGKLGDSLAVKTVLEEGFTKFPENQGVLIGLINFYIQTGESPDQLFALLDKAKINEPNNASLYNVEGDIHKKLGHKEEAIASYLKSNEINPEYEYGFIGIGTLYYDEALVLQDKAANEMDDRKWSAIMEDFEAALANAIEPFEKAFNISKNNDIKIVLAEYLKNIYYRFSSKSDEYMENYKKYNDIVKNGL